MHASPPVPSLQNGVPLEINEVIRGPGPTLLIAIAWFEVLYGQDGSLGWPPCALGMQQQPALQVFQKLSHHKHFARLGTLCTPDTIPTFRHIALAASKNHREPGEAPDSGNNRLS